MLQIYSPLVLEHFARPRNVGWLDPQATDTGTATAGTLICGDVIRLQLRMNGGEIIVETKFKAQAAVTIIAACSWVTEWLQGKSLAVVMGLQSADISAALSLPPLKVHSALLVADAVKAAIADWRQKNA